MSAVTLEPCTAKTSSFMQERMDYALIVWERDTENQAVLQNCSAKFVNQIIALQCTMKLEENKDKENCKALKDAESAQRHRIWGRNNDKKVQSS